MKRSLTIFQYGSNLNVLPQQNLSPHNYITISVETSPYSSSSSSSSVASSSIDMIVQLQLAIQKKVTSLIEGQGHQSIYGENYTSLGEWLHGDSENFEFLHHIHTNLIEYGMNGTAFYDAMCIWSQYFC